MAMTRIPVVAAATLALIVAAGAALAQASGDPAAGEAHFARQCVSCHVVVDPSGETLAGRSARTGPAAAVVEELARGL